MFLGIVFAVCRLCYILLPNEVTGIDSILPEVFKPFINALFNLTPPTGENGDKSSIIEIFTLVFVAYTSKQIMLQKKSADMDISNTIYAENVGKRSNKKIGTAIEQVKMLMATYKGRDDYEKIKEDYNNDRAYDQLRKLVFHYEYLGYLVYYNRIDFHFLFDTITLPEKLMEEALNDDYGASLVEILRDKTPDSWVGFEYLYRSYLLMRAKDKNWKLKQKGNGEDTTSYNKCKEEWEACWNSIPK